MKLSTLALAASLAAPAAQPPPAVQFGKIFTASANAYAVVHHDSRRVSAPHCVEASRGHYMCAYTAKTPEHAHECHLIQARWTPTAASTITVTLSGRVRRCGSLREALHSLG
jgi:hypothetical protein